MASLIAKKLSRLPIGTGVELTYELETFKNERVTGTVIDSDFSEGLEIQMDNGETRVLDFSVIKGVQVKRSLESILRELPVGSTILYSYGDPENRTPNLQGEVTENDQEESLEIRSKSGEETILSYSTIRSLLVESSSQQTRPAPPPQAAPAPAPAPAPAQTITKSVRPAVGANRTEMNASAAAKRRPVIPLYDQEPESTSTPSDTRIKFFFDTLPKTQQRKLAAAYDSFKYGVKISSLNKMDEAARKARQIWLAEDAKGFEWRQEAALLCGYMMRRSKILDHSIFAQGRCFWEAALTTYKEGEYVLLEVYTVLSVLLDSRKDRVRDATIFLAKSCTKSDDISGLHILNERLPGGGEGLLRPVLNAAMEYKGLSLSGNPSIREYFRVLDSAYPGRQVEEEILRLLPSKDSAARPAVDGATAEADEVYDGDGEVVYGSISKLFWTNHTGVVTGDNGETYSFEYTDIVDPDLRKTISECYSSNLNGKSYLISFVPENGKAKQITPDDDPVGRARAIARDERKPGRFQEALDLAKKALDSKDRRRALVDIIRYSFSLYREQKNPAVLREAISLYEKDRRIYISGPSSEMDLAQCYNSLGNTEQMMVHAEKSLSLPEVSPKQRVILISQYIRMLEALDRKRKDLEIQEKILTRTHDWEAVYRQDLSTDRITSRIYLYNVLPSRLKALCALERLDEAEKVYTQISPDDVQMPALTYMMEDLRKKIAARPAPEPVVEEVPAVEPETPAAASEEAPVSSESEAPAEEAAPAAEAEPAAEDVETEVEEDEAEEAETEADEEAEEEPAAEEEEAENEEEAEEEPAEEPIPGEPYQDKEGWDALKLSEEDVIQYALQIRLPEQIPGLLTYLRAGALLNSNLSPILHLAALAANDPAERLDYSFMTMQSAQSEVDPRFQVFCDCCLSAIFLRCSFSAGKDYDYTVQTVRSSLNLPARYPILNRIDSTMEELRRLTEISVEAYLGYDHQDVQQVEENLKKAVHRADELYTRFILTAPRENSSLARLLETRKIIFARDGYFARMLRAIIDNDTALLDKEKSGFMENHLNHASQCLPQYINTAQIDEVIARGWEDAAELMPTRRNNATLQGNRRNNLRSNISEILNVICEVYMLREESQGLVWQSGKGLETCHTLQDQLSDQLHELVTTCESAINAAEISYEEISGLTILSATARELKARLDGTLDPRQRTYFYADFLKSDQITLNSKFLPELSSTFCALPDFNILARIRAHLEGPRMDDQSHIDFIYSETSTANNYGTAAQIIAYREAMGEPALSLPGNATGLAAQAEEQAQKRLEQFRATYAMAVNCGQIMQNDPFCHTLENTLRYWFVFCSRSRNFGFLNRLIEKAEAHILESAKPYEAHLMEELDRIVAAKHSLFDANPTFADAIRSQITGHNFLVAEEWMTQVRNGHFTLNVMPHTALDNLAGFWNSYDEHYEAMQDGSRSLSDIMGRQRVHNRVTRLRQSLIEGWPKQEGPTTPARVQMLIQSLGWKYLTAEPFTSAEIPDVELYRVKPVNGTAGVTGVLHPIDAFGSELAKNGMYVVCLYGPCDCDALVAKLKSLDVLEGAKLVLADCVLSGDDRRLLAKKLKEKALDLRSVCLIVDRVLLHHLIIHFNEDTINPLLLSLGMPFSFCQPFTDSPAPDVFIGRDIELRRVEDPDGVNLIYGGHRLGKSAILARACFDIEIQPNKRAIVANLKGMDCAEAARMLSSLLLEAGILDNPKVTDDWKTLARRLKKRLGKPDMTYFLLMLDEADDFVASCSACKFVPLTELKNLQQSSPGQFKFVMTGLSSYDRYNRDANTGRNTIITRLPALPLTPLPLREAEELLTMPLSYLGFTMPDKAIITHILTTTCCYPGLIQLCCRKLVEAIREPDYGGCNVSNTPSYVVTDSLLRRVLTDQEFISSVRETLNSVLHMDADRGGYYYPLALVIGYMHHTLPGKLWNGYTVADVMEVAQKELSVPVLEVLEHERVQSLLAEMAELNILVKVEEKGYRLASRQFLYFLGSAEEIFDKLCDLGGGNA